MDMQDRRVRRTQKLLAKALIALTLEKGYESITIRDITERADIGYATFFRHYHDKDALLHDMLDEVLAELYELLPTVPDDNGAEFIGTPLFRYVQENSNVIRVLLSSRGSSSILQHIIDVTSQKILRENAPLPGSAIPANVAAYHLVNSSIALIQWWLEQGMPYPPEHMGIIFHQLIIQPTHSIAFAHHDPAEKRA
ncbi:MAG: TetR/AcrR family transcriptional regulator [Ktedonobacteraceae bacterium]